MTAAVGILFLVFFCLLAIGVPVLGSIGLGVIANGLAGGAVSLAYIGRNMVQALDSFTILAVPLFILAGEIMGQGGISKKLFNFANACLGRFTGGVPMATVLTCMLFGAISGSGQATFAAVGSIMIPAMEEQGYDKNFVTGVTASSGGLGVLIPPSLPMVMFAITVGSVSIGSMLTAGIIPGVLCGIALMVYCYIYCKRHPVKIDHTEKTMGIFESLKDGFWALLTPVVILGGIYSGLFTATEAAAVACVYALIVSLFIYRTVTFKQLPGILLRAAGLNAPILIIVAAATVLGRALAIQNVPEALAATILSVTSNKWMIMLLLNILLLIVGMLMETLSAITILAPILMPVAAGIGIDPIHFGVIMVANLAIGFVTPPVGTNLYTAASITGIPVKNLCKAIVGPVIALLVVQVFLVLIQQLSTFLPSLL